MELGRALQTTTSTARSSPTKEEEPLDVCAWMQQVGHSGAGGRLYSDDSRAPRTAGWKPQALSMMHGVGIGMTTGQMAQMAAAVGSATAASNANDAAATEAAEDEDGVLVVLVVQALSARRLRCGCRHIGLGSR